MEVTPETGGPAAGAASLLSCFTFSAWSPRCFPEVSAEFGTERSAPGTFQRGWLVLATFVEGFTGFLHFLIGFRGKEWQRAMIFFQKWYLWTVLSHNKAVISWDLWRVAKC